MTILKKHSKPSRTITTTQPALAPDLWDAVLQPYADRPTHAFIMAQTFCMLRETLSLPKGRVAVSKALDAGINELFPFTDIHAASLQLYHLAVAGNLRPEFEPRAFVTLATKANEKGSAR